MSSNRRFRFGVQISRGDDDLHWPEKARQVEDLGYATLSISDHFYDQLGPIAALMSAADATSTLRLGTCVCSNDFRHPVVLAKEAATIDLLSGGRFFLGVGAGWARYDYEEAGFAYDPPGQRIDRLVEGVAVLKGLFSDGPFSFAGKHYRIANLDGRPKPLQRPHPPLLIGGGGKRILSFAGREADIVNINVDLRSGTLEGVLKALAMESRTAERISWIREAAGSRFQALELCVTISECIVTAHRDSVAGSLADRLGVSVEQLLESPHILIGNVDEIVGDLERRRERYDISFIMVMRPAVEQFAPVVRRLHGK